MIVLIVNIIIYLFLCIGVYGLITYEQNKEKELRKNHEEMVEHINKLTNLLKDFRNE